MNVNGVTVSEVESASFRGPEGAIVAEVVLRALVAKVKDAMECALDPVASERYTNVEKGKVVALRDMIKTVRRIIHQVPDDGMATDVLDHEEDEDYEFIMSEVE